MPTVPRTVIRCSGCGWHDVVELANFQAEDARDPGDDKRTGHHVHPEDPDTDWICYGRFVAINRAALVTAFDTQGPRIVAALRPDPAFAGGDRAAQESRRAARLAAGTP